MPDDYQPYGFLFVPEEVIDPPFGGGEWFHVTPEFRCGGGWVSARWHCISPPTPDFSHCERRGREAGAVSSGPPPSPPAHTSISTALRIRGRRLWVLFYSLFSRYTSPPLSASHHDPMLQCHPYPSSSSTRYLFLSIYLSVVLPTSPPLSFLLSTLLAIFFLSRTACRNGITVHARIANFE